MGAIRSVRVLSVYSHAFRLRRNNGVDIRDGLRLAGRSSLTVTCAPKIKQIYLRVTRRPSHIFSLAVGNGAITVIASNDTILKLNGLNPTKTLPIVRNGTLLFGGFTKLSTFPVYLSARSASRVIRTIGRLTPIFNNIGLRSVDTPHYFRVRTHLHRRLSVPIFRSSRRNATVIALTTLDGTLGLIGGSVARIGIIVGKTKTTKITVTGLLRGTNIDAVILYSSGNVLSRDHSSLGTRGRRFTMTRSNALTSTVHKTSMFLKIDTPKIISIRVIRSVTTSPVIFTVTGPVPRVRPRLIASGITIVTANHDSCPGRVGGILTFPNILHKTLSYHTRRVAPSVCLRTTLTVTSLINPRRLSQRRVVPSMFSRQMTKTITDTIGRTTHISKMTHGWT